MRPTKPDDTRTVAYLSDPKYVLCTGDDAIAVREHIGNKAEGQYGTYDTFLVYAKDGDYVEVWGMVGCVPYMNKLATRLV